MADHTRAVIWVVDDDRSIRWVLERALEQAGFETVTFERGETALDRLSVEQPDAIISDIRMPGSDGLALLAAVRGLTPRITDHHDDRSFCPR